MTIFTQNQQETAQETQITAISPPPMYQVILLNDDYTPMDFVVLILQKVFHKNGAQAEKIMLQVHHEGRGVCGVYTRDIAATRVDMVLLLAKAAEHPLKCIMEPLPNHS